MVTFKSVTVLPRYGQYWAALLLKHSGDKCDHSDKLSTPVAVDLNFLGSEALSVYYNIFNQGDLNRNERRLFIPSTFLTLDVVMKMRNPEYEPLLGEFPQTQSLLIRLANRESYIHFRAPIPKEHERPMNTIYCPRLQDLPLPSNLTTDLVEHHVNFDTKQPHGLNHTFVGGSRFPDVHSQTLFLVAHPADFLVRTIQRIMMERRSAGASSGASKTLHLNRRNAQVFLLRLFVEVITASQQDDTSLSDAVWKPRLESAVTKDFDNLSDFAREINHDLSEEVIQRLAKDAASWQIWQISLETDQDYGLRFDQLVQRNTQAFRFAKQWLNKTSDTEIEPPSYDPSVPRSPAPRSRSPSPPHSPPRHDNFATPIGGPFAPSAR